MVALLQMRLRLWPHRGSSKIPERIAALFDFAPSMLYLPAAERVWRLHRGRRPEPQEAASSLSLGTAAGAPPLRSQADAGNTGSDGDPEKVAISAGG